jgi:hypothetical protein
MTRGEPAEFGFVVEIGGRPILALAARSMQTARALCAQSWFFDELRRHRCAGRPIWNGTSHLTLRVAHPAEQMALQAARAAEIARREFDGPVFAFLIPLDPDLH